MIAYILNKIKLNYNHYFALSQRTKTIFFWLLHHGSFQLFLFVSVYIWLKIQIELRISFVFASGSFCCVFQPSEHKVAL